MNLEEALAVIGKKVVKDARANLTRAKKRASGNLYNTLKYVVEDSKLKFEMASYGRYVDQGRKPGKYVPVNSLKEWMKIKGIDSKYSFVINRAIKERGIKATFFFTRAYDNNEKQLDKVIESYTNSLLKKTFKK